MIIQTDEELRRLYHAGRGLILNVNDRHLHAADCYFVDDMLTTTRKEWFASLAELRDAHGDGWSHGCQLCEVGTAAVSDASRARPVAARVPEDADDRNEFIVRGPEPKGVVVEAWSQRYVPFEPRQTGQRALKATLLERLAMLRADPAQILHATFSGSLPRGADVENALFYNLDTDGAPFRASAFRGLLFEHDPTPPAAAADGREFACAYAYRLVPRRTRLSCWRETRELARWDALDLDAARPAGLADGVWLALRRARRASAITARASAAPFAVFLELHPPVSARPNPVQLVKGLMDGVVAAHQAHLDADTVADVGDRLAHRVPADAAELSGLLGDDSGAVLGATHRLAVAWRDTIQWQPADDKLVAGCVLVGPPDGEAWGLSGRVAEVRATA